MNQLLYTNAEARALKYEQRVIAAIRIDRYLLKTLETYRLFLNHNAPLDVVQTAFTWLERAALSRYCLTHDVMSCVGTIVEGRLVLHPTLEQSKCFEASVYAIEQERILEP